MKRIKKIHFIGIGGSGMGGIAEVMARLGYIVTGSDLAKSAMTDRLSNMGIRIAFSHIAENVAECDAVVVSSAIPNDNIELHTALRRRIPIVPRAEMLAELMRFKHGIAVAGSHGKTTTTSLIASIMAVANRDPTFVIGGQLNSFKSNAQLGTGKYFIAEADESDASFLHLSPILAVITNIDNDHLSFYGGDFNKIKATFIEFIKRLPFYGVAILCCDDKEVRSIIPNILKAVITYGFSHDADIRVINWEPTNLGSKFAVSFPTGDTQEFTLSIPGRHNVQNALAAIATAFEEGIELDAIRTALANFKGIGRRFNVYQLQKYDGKNFTLIDDYGHHPREIEVVIETIKLNWPLRRLIMVFQPHRYTRTKDLYAQFVSVLAKADLLYLLDIYPAAEEPIVGVNSVLLADAIKATGLNNTYYIASQDLQEKLDAIILADDIVLFQGAGNVGAIAQRFIEQYALYANA